MNTTTQIHPGTMLGRFEVLMPVAEGGMARVWAARPRRARGAGETVAVKMMRPELAHDAMYERMFVAEATLTERIRHPNVCEVFEHGEHDGIRYIVMEWVEGETLSALLKSLNGPIPMALSLRIALQTAAGLHAAHELRDESGRPLLLAHRDVSPPNILCTDDGVVKVVDFGVAKVVGSADTMAGALKGKFSYMSPEQTRGHAVDRRTDVFALGIVLYRMTTGRHPFAGGSVLDTVNNIRRQPMPRPRQEDPGFPLEVEEILARCLQKDPDQRYQTMAELGEALGRALLGMGGARDDLGAFVRSARGEDGLARCAAVREAARVADESYAFDVAETLILPPSRNLQELIDEVLEERFTSRQESGTGQCWIHREATFPAGSWSRSSWPVAPPPPPAASRAVSMPRASLGARRRSPGLSFGALCVVAALLGATATALGLHMSSALAAAPPAAAGEVARATVEPRP